MAELYCRSLINTFASPLPVNRESSSLPQNNPTLFCWEQRGNDGGRDEGAGRKGERVGERVGVEGMKMKRGNDKSKQYDGGRGVK